MGFRYIGSKDKLSDIIISEIKSTKKGAKHIIDLMAGTGLFSWHSVKKVSRFQRLML